MARTANPNDVLDQFVATAESARQRFLQLYSTLSASDASTLSLRKSLTSDLAFRVGTEWELFQHRWHLAAISRRPAVFVAATQKILDEALRKGEARAILDALWSGATTVPKGLTIEQIDDLIDPDGYNVTFKDGEAWAAKAAAHLEGAYADAVRSIVSNPEDESLVALLKAARNVIAHKSKNSLQELNLRVRSRPPGESIGLVGAANAPLLRDGGARVRDVETYLHSWSYAAQSRRVSVLTRRILEVAEQLRM
jgi:hypothetical protein